mgnify:CR=1 FL=1
MAKNKENRKVTKKKTQPVGEVLNRLMMDTARRQNKKTDNETNSHFSSKGGLKKYLNVPQKNGDQRVLQVLEDSLYQFQ